MPFLSIFCPRLAKTPPCILSQIKNSRYWSLVTPAILENALAPILLVAALTACFAIPNASLIKPIKIFPPEINKFLVLESFI